jgi:hypothetical protein
MEAAGANQAGGQIRVVKYVSDDASKSAGRTWRGMAEFARARRLNCEKYSLIALARPALARTVRRRLDNLERGRDELLEHTHELERARELAVCSAFCQPDRAAQAVVIASCYEHHQLNCNQIHTWLRQLADEHLT